MTAVVLPVLLGLGAWQLRRAEWKAGVLAELARNARQPVATLKGGADLANFQFRRVRLDLACAGPPPLTRAGRNARGEAGFSFLLACRRTDVSDLGQGQILLDIGWDRRPDGWRRVARGLPAAGTAARAEGVLVRRDGNPGWVLVSTAARPPLEPSAPPSLETIPNNHLSYAIQWFSFAAILAAVYAAFVVRWRRNG